MVLLLQRVYWEDMEIPTEYLSLFSFSPQYTPLKLIVKVVELDNNIGPSVLGHTPYLVCPFHRLRRGSLLGRV